MAFSWRIWLLSLFSTIGLFGAEIHEKVVICGVCRNVESRLEKTQEIMESIGNLFEDYRIVVYENNSTDRTKEMLSSWAHANSRVWVKSEDLLPEEFGKIFVNVKPDGSFFVPEQIARARNIVLQEAMSEKYRDYPFLIWMDMDFVRPPHLMGFIDTFNSDQEWDAVFAYGIDPDHNFWDWYAFRDHNYPLGSELLGVDWWNIKKHLKLAKRQWYPVYSAFGGCGIYKKGSIEGCHYSAVVTKDLEIHAKQLIEEGKKSKNPYILQFLKNCKNLEGVVRIEQPLPNLPYIRNPNMGILLHDEPDALLWRMSSFVYQYPSVCEHVTFHASMIVRGHDKLFINPKLIFRYGG